MLVTDRLIRTGDTLFGWRSYVLLAFIPFMAVAAMQGEQVERAFGPFGEALEALAIGMVAAGQKLRILTGGFVPAETSGRNSAGQVARDLNTTGLYSLVRNPLYLGNSLMYLGLGLCTQSLVLALVMALVLVIYYERIIAAEEAFLAWSFGDRYLEWAARTPAFLPRLTGWIAPSMPFSLRTVIRREHASFYGAVVALYLVEFGLHHLAADAELFWPGWHMILGVATFAEAMAIWMKRRTRLLVVPGR